MVLRQPIPSGLSKGALIALFACAFGCSATKDATAVSGAGGSAPKPSEDAGGDAASNSGNGPDVAGNGASESPPATSSGGGGSSNAGSSSGGNPGGGVSGSADAGAGAGSGGAPSGSDSLVDLEPYFPEAEDLCVGDNPCVIGECQGDTNPCTADDPLAPRVIGTAEEFAAIRACTSFKGSLSFSGSELTSLEGLSLLTIDGDLSIGIDSLDSLAGLESLISVSGSVSFGRVASSLVVKDLTGLSGLRYVGNRFDINESPTLESLSGLNAELIGSLYIANCPELRDLSALANTCVDDLALLNLPSLGTFEQAPIRADMNSIVLLALPAITSLAGFEELERLGGLLRITDLAALEDTSALNRLLGLANLELENVPNLSDFAGFENVEYLGNLTLAGEGPTTLNGLGQLQYFGQLTVAETHRGIADYTGLSSLREFGALDTRNGVALDGLRTVERIGIFTMDDNLTLDALANVERIDSFWFTGTGPLPTLPPALALIGRLRVDGTTSTNLAAFDAVTVLDGLDIGVGSQLENLEGLHHDGTFGQGLSLDRCGDLDLSALSGLTSVERLSIAEAQLSSLVGLEQLEVIEGHLYIYDTELVDLDGLSGLKSVRGSLQIENNSLLSSLQGLSKLSTLGEERLGLEVVLSIANNPMLPQCQADELYERFDLPVDGTGNDESGICK